MSRYYYEHDGCGSSIEVSCGKVVSVNVTCEPRLFRTELERNSSRATMRFIMRNMIKNNPEHFMQLYRAIKGDSLCFPIAEQVRSEQLSILNSTTEEPKESTVTFVDRDFAYYDDDMYPSRCTAWDDDPYPCP